MILVIDPGRIKCGLAVMDKNAKVLEKRVIEIESLVFEAYELVNRYAVDTIVVGKGTNSKEVEAKLKSTNMPADIVFINEIDSTVEAKDRFFKENKPSGLMRLIPRGLLSPNRPIDDYAAIILGERYLKSQKSSGI